MSYYIVKYTGPFGFIKPWSAVRDGETFSQQFLTPSIVAGIERKIFPELLNEPFGHYKIKRHRLSYGQMSPQHQEQILSRGWDKKKDSRIKKQGITIRSILLNPVLYLAFLDEADANKAAQQHVCLCRNEDILLPFEMSQVTEEEFDSDQERFAGYELMFEENEQSFLVGYNRYAESAPMYGWLKVLGNPVKTI